MTHLHSFEVNTPVDNGNTFKLFEMTQRQRGALVALFVLLGSFFVGVAGQIAPAFGQTSPAPPGQVTTGDTNAGQTSPGASATQATSPDPYYNANQYTNLVQQQAEQNTTAVAQNVEQQLWPDFGAYNDTYDGLSAFWGDDIISNLFSNIGQLIGKWLSEFINGWVADSVQFLTGFLRVFVLNPNIAVNGLGNGNGPADDISPYIRQGADIMYGIAVDLLLLLFVLCIWKYWAEAAWRGGGNMMGAVGRLIFTAGLLLAWPTIYAFEIQITNEMIKAIYFNSADQVAMLDAAMAAAVKGGLVAGAGLLANATAPVAGQVFGGALGTVGGAGGPLGLALGTVGSLVAFVGLIVYLVLGGILIAELIYILVLKSIQTALLCAQYMFAPLFLVFFATPDTENVCSGFVRSFVEVSLWTFVWVGMLKIMVIIVLSNFNPWGKIVMTVGVLQLMIQVPSFLSRAQISPMSDFVSAGLVTGGLLKGGSALANMMGNRAQQFANVVGNFNDSGAKGAPKSQATELNGLGNDVARPDLLKDIRAASATGQVPGGVKGAGKGDKDKPEGGPENPGGQPLNPAGGPNGGKTDPTKKDEDPTKAGVTPPAKNIDPAAGGVPAGPTADKVAPGTAGGPTADKSLGESLANGAKNGALGAVVAAGVGAGLAAGEAGAAAGPKAKDGTTDGANAGQALNAQQDVAARLAAMNGGAGAGVGSDGKPNTPPKLDENGKPIKVAGGELPGGVGPNGEKKDGVNAVPTPDATVTGTVKGAVGAKGANPGAPDAEGKGKELDTNLGAMNPAAAGLNKPDGTDANKAGGVGQQIEMEFERGAEGVAAANVAGLGGGIGKMGDVKDDGKGGADGGKTGAAGGKTTVSGGTLNPAGSAVNGAVGTTDVSAKLLDKKPGQVVSGNPAALAPSAATGNLNSAVTSTATGRNIDPATAGGTSDVTHDASDPGAPITTPGAKTEVHSTASAQQLATAGTAAGGVIKDVSGKVISGGPGGANANLKPGDQMSLPLDGGKMNPGAAAPGSGQTNLNAAGQVVQGTTTATTAAGGRGLDQQQTPGIVNTELALEEGAVAGMAAASILNRVEGRTSPAGGQNQQTVQTTATGRVFTGGPPGTPVPPVNQAASMTSAPPSQFTQASSGTGGAPVAAVAGGAGGGNGTPPPPVFDTTDNPEGLPGTTLPSGEAGMGSQPASNRTQGSTFDGYMQAGYRHVPYRVAAAAIRLAQGATLAPSRSGKPEIIQDNQGHMMHVRFGEGSTDEQRAMQIMSGAYGELMSTDAEAYDAARQSSIDAGEHKPKGLAQNIAAGIMSYNGGSWTQTAAAKQSFGRSMAKHATLGAQSYVAGEAGNAYTEYLTNRYGPMSDEQQAWGVHMMTDSSSPESGWSWRMGPATDALIQNGLPISPVHRAVAANPSVLKSQPWLRGAAIRGGVQYMQSRAEQSLPEGTNGLVQDAWYGNQSQAMAPEVVNTLGAITLNMGEKACADTATIDKVAAMVGPQGRPEDYVNKYNQLKGGAVAMARIQQRFAPTGGGGGGNMGSMTMNGGTMPSGPSDIGGVTTSVSGGLYTGGGGGGPRNNAEVDVLFGASSGGGTINPNSITPPNINLPNQGGTTQANFRFQPGAQQGGAGSNQSFSMRVPGQNVGSTNEQVQVGSVSYSGGSGGGNTADRVVHGEVYQESSSGGGGNYGPSSSAMQQAFSGALQQHGGSDNMIQRTIADLTATGMPAQQIYDHSRSESDPGKYQLLETAFECQTRDIPMTTVAVAARAMGSSNVTPQHVQIVQNMLDADPRWSPQNISYSDVYTAQALTEAHESNPSMYGQAYLSKDYVDTVRSDPGFTPRPVPMRNAIGQIVDYARSKVPDHLLMKKTQQGYGGGSQGGGRGRGGFGGGSFG
ncbi:MAG: hypothetical protein KGS72_02890 [Cyanobacteria bacterium REEB67]|nr:hypothetical protein [Cyanobacteria bacterium REEB67]